MEQAALAADLQTVRKLSILIPFTSASRQRMEQALQPVARRIRVSRQQIAKLVCCRECLCRDLLATEREDPHGLQQFSAASMNTFQAMSAQPSASVGIARGSVPVLRQPPTSFEMDKSASDSDLGKAARLSISHSDGSVADAARPLVFSHIISSSPGRPSNSPLLPSFQIETVQEEQDCEQSEETGHDAFHDTSDQGMFNNSPP